ncbi:FMN-binding protein [Solihabitans fulvus]|uniref:FMN-binding protein n=1 Tax=Solihabitans fulvus TaxID=1892852 RepID=A0A5B2XD50_9PSEU|nr:FMN-binding protein [Solihabitans fulvus]KAA2261668.1 FMN-binding protein [Solihabitans fulvus]
MRRITIAVVGTIAALVLLFSYRTSLGGSARTPPAAIAGTGSGGGTSADSTAGGSATPPTSVGTAGSGTVQGSAADTRWGVVQVEVTVQGGKITGVRALRVPDGNGRDQEINSYAVPILVQETLQAQSAKIDAVSGATVTSDGYATSLQAALDKVGK